jgi:hypothetical protein
MNLMSNGPDDDVCEASGTPEWMLAILARSGRSRSTERTVASLARRAFLLREALVQIEKHALDSWQRKIVEAALKEDARHTGDEVEACA